MKSYSTIRPAEWDVDSSPTTVYHNTSVVEIPATEETPLMYEYDVALYERAVAPVPMVDAITNAESAVDQLLDTIGGAV